MKHWPYRFKTEKEFIKEFGLRWRGRLHGNSFPPSMDYLLGKPFPYEFNGAHNVFKLNINNEPEDSEYTWGIVQDMLIKNEMPKPNYLPKRKRN